MPAPHAAAVLVAALALAGCSATPPVQAPDPVPSRSRAAPTADPGFAALEEEFGARLGVFALDTGSGRTVEHRADERFAFASTCKALAAAAVLDSGADPAAALPGSTRTLEEVARAAVTVSDNTAANLLFDALGGPAGFEEDLRALGDTVTEAEREEPDLNAWSPGEVRDTSSPRAFGKVLQAYAVGDALEADDRELFVQWLRDNTTGDEQIRAGVPAGWVVGDKTGHAGVYGNQNDIAVVWPAGGAAPWVLAVFSDRPEADAESDDALIARAAGLVVAELS
ncbi:class A beta-lactamase [Kineococcus sp. SYSU DK003]|uniref:class A beta-lactamase n=1 Tax=Kineococcus sp. SYSU DK003 TaxID=3383124 RepID=UPI003D7D7FC7